MEFEMDATQLTDGNGGDSQLQDGAKVKKFVDYGYSPSHQQVGDQFFNLENPTEAVKAKVLIDSLYQKLQSGELKEYEGSSTDQGEGGRGKLFHDHLTVSIWNDKHAGKHSMDEVAIHKEVDRIMKMNAQKFQKK